VSLSDIHYFSWLNFCQEVTSRPSTSTLPPSSSQTPVAAISPSFAPDMHFWTVIDPDIARENPVEDKNRRLVRSHRSSPYDRELKPNAKIRDELGVSHIFCFPTVPPFTSETKNTSLQPILGNPQLRSQSTSQFGGERPYLELPILPRSGQTRSYQIPQIRHVA